MYCIHCRKINKNGVRVCRHCGKSLLRTHSKISKIFRRKSKPKQQGTMTPY